MHVSRINPTPRPRASVRPSSYSSSRAFTLIEMLTTVAALIIVLGLMVSLARHVRARSAEELTTQTLANLDVLLAKYQSLNGGQLPNVTPFVSPSAAATRPAMIGNTSARTADETALRTT